MKLNDLFETKPCTRCGGSGHYSYNSMTGTVCFGCKGRGYQLTKAGAAARDAWIAAYTRTVPVMDVKPGDQIVVADPMRNKRLVLDVEISAQDPLNEGHWMFQFVTGSALGGYHPMKTGTVELPVTREMKRDAYNAISHMTGAIGTWED